VLGVYMLSCFPPLIKKILHKRCGINVLVSYILEKAADTASIKKRIAKTEVEVSKVDGFYALHSTALVVLSILLVFVPITSEASDNTPKLYDINVPELNAAEALNLLADQTGATFLFPYDVAQSRQANTVVGRYTLKDALMILLKNSGLSGDLSKKGAIKITVVGDARLHNSNEGKQLMKTKRSILSSVIAFFVGAGGSAYAQGPSGIDKKVEGNLILEEVVVTANGYRESLEKALEIKRYGTGFVDAIVATDIASFPDQNLAEALQRIPGVAIERSSGQGKTVSVRSLGSQFTHSTINGLNASSASGKRELQFDLFSSDLVQTVSVKKSPTASDEEGGVGGTVAIRTARPFDYDGFKVVVSAEGAHNSVSDEVDPRMAFLISDTYADDTIGVLLGLTSEDRTHRSNSSEMANNYLIGDLKYFKNDETGTATLPAGVDPSAYYLGFNRLTAAVNAQEKRGSLLAVQYRPTENLQLGTDIMVGTFRDLKYQYQSEVNFTGTSNLTSATVKENAMVSGTFSDVDHNLTSYNTLKESDFWQAGFNADWQSDIWTIKGLAALAQTEEEESLDKYQYRTKADNGFEASDQNFNLLAPQPDISTYYARQRNDEDRTKLDKKSLLQLDFERLVDISWVDNIQFGLSYNRKSTERDKFKGSLNLEDLNAFADADSALPIGDLLPGGNTLLSGQDIFPSSFTIMHFDDIDAQFGGLDLTIKEDVGNYFKIEEDVLAAYIQSDFEFDIARFPTKLNVGLRYADTEQRSGGYFRLRENGTDVATKQTVERGYDNWLPSLNMVTELSDQLMLRFSTATVMTRPALSSLTGKFEVNEENNSISSGNPYLDPLEANQYDLALEYYFAPESLVAVGYFYKDLKTYLTSSDRGTISYNGGTYNYSTTANAEGAVIEGAEFIYQQPFTFLPAPFDGLGVNFNYTYLESTAGTEVSKTGGTASLKGLSRNSFNTVLYYEKIGFDLRFAYNYKGKSVFGVNQGAIVYTTDDYGQLDISAGYQINDNIKVTLKGINVTEEDEYRYSDYGSIQLPYRLVDNGRRVSLGVRITL
jgi:iron complex outermembrane recepter protein